MLRDDALDVRRRNILIDEHREIARDGRIFRQRLEMEILRRVFHERLDIHLEEIDLLLDAEILRRLRMELTDDGDHLAPFLEAGRLARMEREMLSCLDRILADAEPREEFLDNAFHIVEVHLLIALVPADFLPAPRDEADELRLFLRQLRERQLLRIEHRCHIEESEIHVLAGEIAHGVFHDARQEAGAHERRLVRERVHDGNGAAKLAFLRHAQLIEELRAREAEGELLRHAERGKDLLDALDEGLPCALASLHHAAERRRTRDVVEAVDARDLLGEILHVSAVVAPGWHGRAVTLLARLLDGEAKLREDVHHAAPGQLRAEAPVDLRRREVDSHGRLRLRIAVHDALCDRAGPHLLQQLAGAFERARRIRHIDTALEPSGCLGVQAAGARRAADARPIEGRRLEDDRRRLLRDLALEPAHDAGKARGMLAVRDDEFLSLGDARAVVERVEVLPRLGATRRERMPRDLIVIIGMHRLPELEHDEVRHIDDVIDGADAGPLEALLHPLRRRRDLDILHHAHAEAIAEILRLYARLDEVGRLGCIVLLTANDRPLRLVPREDGDLAHETEHAEAIAAVRRELELEHDIVEAEHVLRRHTDRRI